MALSVEKLLTDAHTLIVRLKSHDSLADGIIANNQELLNKVEAMKQYQDDITELNEIAKHRPRSTLVLGIAQENRQIRQLQQENRELEASLEEHQTALELIMQKYREHTVKLLQSNQMERALKEKEVVDKNSMCQLMDKIDEMAGVMQKAIEVDETQGCEDKERLSRLEIENKALRELLEICTTSRDRIVMQNTKPGGVNSKASSEEKDDVDDDDDTTDTESDNTILEVSPKAEEENKTLPVEKEKKESKKETSMAESKKETSMESKKETSTVESKKETLTMESKKKTDAGKGEQTSKDTGLGNTVKAAGPSKSTGDIKKGRVSTSSPVKRTTSATTIRKDTLKKSPSVETKKDVKSKTGAKTGIKK